MQVLEVPARESAPAAYRLLVGGVITVVAGTAFVLGGVVTGVTGPVCQPGVTGVTSVSASAEVGCITP